MKQVKEILKIGSAFIGVLVGAGFASGQEVVQYFTSFGLMGIAGGILATALFAFLGMALAKIGSRMHTTSHKDAVYEISGPFFGRIIDYVLIFTLFGVGVVMLAGAGSNISQQFGLPAFVGTTLMVVLVFLTGVLRVDRVISVISSITPFLILFVIIISIYSLSTIDGSLIELDSIAKEQYTTLPNWFISAVNYVSFNTAVGASMTLVMGGAERNEKTAALGGLAGGLGLGALIVLSHLAIFSKIDTVGGMEIPMLGIVDQISPILGSIMAIVLFAMIFNTAVSMFFSFSARFMEIGTNKFKIFLAATLAVGYIASFIGFTDLLSIFYPLIGYLGLFLFVALIVALFRLDTLAKRKSDQNNLRKSVKKTAK
ncbi:YkvI family membrane protein [Virgibacillus sediminis]|uniref:Membrane protein YkvI n=1 Tax=Virgibacillus sediminis TaxID=202260 RepID=A0ABV7AAC1_9BACI